MSFESSCKSRSNLILLGIESLENTETSLLLIDTAGCEMEESSSVHGSRANEGEAALVTMHVENLIKRGLDVSEIAVITPYNLQVELIKHQLKGKYGNLEIRSVDGFQGREKEAVVISLVRSNPQKEIGFLKEYRRLNVAITRAKCHVCVIGDSDTISADAMLKSLLDHIESHGEIMSAFNYQQELRDILISQPSKMELNRINIEQQPKGAKKKKVNTVKDTNVRMKKVEAKEDDRAIRKQKLLLQVQRFILNSSEQRLEFPSDLEARDRAIVHEIAEELDLHHKSQGEGKLRRIVIEKIAKQEPEVFEEDVEMCDTIKEVPETTKVKSAKKVEANKDDREFFLRKQELLQQVQRFIRNASEQRLEFPSGLQVRDRAIIHEIAEELDLHHKSQGEGKSRRIVIEKISKQEPEALEEVPENLEVKKELIKCSGCQKNIPIANVELHKVRCSSSNVKVAQKKSKSMKKQEAKKKEEDIDKLLESFSAENTKCQGEGCKASVKTVFSACKFCKMRFCFSHGMPEIHGCGEAAKRMARQQISNDGKLYPGSGRPSNLPDARRKANLQAKLDKKLEEMESSRKSKPSKGKK